MEAAPSKATVLTQDLIVKSGREEFPGLAANEFLCMSIAKEGVPLFLMRFRTFRKPLSMRVSRGRSLATRMDA